MASPSGPPTAPTPFRINRAFAPRRRLGPAVGLIAVHWHAVLTADLKVGLISGLVVDPVRRCNGVARLLLKAASRAAHAAGRGELVLGAPAGPDDLRAFCLATGFAETGAVFTRPLRKRD